MSYGKYTAKSAANAYAATQRHALKAMHAAQDCGAPQAQTIATFKATVAQAKAQLVATPGGVAAYTALLAKHGVAQLPTDW